MSGISKGCEYIKNFDQKKNAISCKFPTESAYRIVGPIGEIIMELCSVHADRLSKEHLHWKFYRLDSKEFQKLQEISQ